jgi:hypothetical protein
MRCKVAKLKRVHPSRSTLVSAGSAASGARLVIRLHARHIGRAIMLMLEAGDAKRPIVSCDPTVAKLVAR